MSNENIQDTIQTPETFSSVEPDFSLKTLIQENSKTISADTVLSLANDISSPTQDIPGAFIEYKLQYIPRQTKFNSQAFIPSSYNVGSTTDIRRDVHKLGKAHKIALPNVGDDTNIVQFRNDYKKNSYVGKLLNQEEFVRQSFAELELGLEYQRANNVLLGKDFTDYNGTTLHATGLKDLIANAKSDSQIAISAIDLTSTTGQKNILYTPAAGASALTTRTEALAQLNTLIEYIKSPNSCFSHISGLMVPGTKELTLLATIATIESIKAINMDYFKQLSDLFDVKVVKAIPKTTIDVEYVDGQVAGSYSNGLTDLQAAIGLNDGEIFIMESNCIKKFDQLTVQSAGKDFPNNLTESHGVQGCPFNDVKADATYCLFSATVLVTKYFNAYEQA